MQNYLQEIVVNINDNYIFLYENKILK